MQQARDEGRANEELERLEEMNERTEEADAPKHKDTKIIGKLSN